jgi:hypothetical protein
MHIHARTYHDEGVGDGEDDAAGAEERPDGDVSDTGERRRIRGRMLLLLLLLLHARARTRRTAEAEQAASHRPWVQLS